MKPKKPHKTREEKKPSKRELEEQLAQRRTFLEKAIKK